MKLSMIRPVAPKVVLTLLLGLPGTASIAYGQTMGGFGNTGGFGSTGGFGNTGGFGSTGGFGNTGGFGGNGMGQPGSSSFGMSGAAPTGGNQTPSTYPGVFGGPGVSGTNVIGNLNTRPLSISASNGGMQASSVFGIRTTPTGGTSGAGGIGGGIGGGFGGGLGGFGGGLGGLGGLGGFGGGLGGLGGLGGFGGGLNNRNRMGAGVGQNGQGAKPVRAVAVPDFEIKTSQLPNVAAQVQTRLAKFPLPEKFRGVSAVYDKGEVVLRGVVSTEADKRLVGRIMKLEPGVDSIRNEITVRGVSSESTAEQIEALPNR